MGGSKVQAKQNPGLPAGNPRQKSQPATPGSLALAKQAGVGRASQSRLWSGAPAAGAGLVPPSRSRARSYLPPVSVCAGGAGLTGCGKASTSASRPTGCPPANQTRNQKSPGDPPPRPLFADTAPPHAAGGPSPAVARQAAVSRRPDQPGRWPGCRAWYITAKHTPSLCRHDPTTGQNSSPKPRRPPGKQGGKLVAGVGAHAGDSPRTMPRGVASLAPPPRSVSAARPPPPPPSPPAPPTSAPGGARSGDPPQPGYRATLTCCWPMFTCPARRTTTGGRARRSRSAPRVPR
jgi:hypothetical protein